MVCSRVMFSEVVGQIMFTWFLDDDNNDDNSGDNNGDNHNKNHTDNLCGGKVMI